MILCTLFPTLPTDAAQESHCKLITWKHRSREQRIFPVQNIFHKEAAESFIILLYCLFSLKKENEFIRFYPPPHSTPNPRRRKNWWACVTVFPILKCQP